MEILTGGNINSSNNHSYCSSNNLCCCCKVKYSNKAAVTTAETVKITLDFLRAAIKSLSQQSSLFSYEEATLYFSFPLSSTQSSPTQKVQLLNSV